MIAARARWIAARSVAALLLAACGGSPNTPDGSTVGSPGGPIPPPTQHATAALTITLNENRHAPGLHAPHYLSPNTRSVSVSLASVNGSPASGARTTVLNTAPNSNQCRRNGSSLVCKAMIDASNGDDVFNVTTYRWSNATGDVLSAGTASAHIASGGGNLRLSNALSLSIGGVIAKLSMSVAQTTFTRGEAKAVPLALNAYDASGAQIVGAAAFFAPITLSVQGDSAGAFTLHERRSGGNELTIARPASTLALSYDGNREASTSISLQASVTQPSSASASIALKVSGSPPPLPAGTVYVLNAGKRAGLGATLTVYDGSHAGNVTPARTLALSSKLYARSVAVDGAGNIYIGYLDNAQGFSPVAGTPDKGNVIAVYGPTASGSDQPASTITADSSTGTALFPIAMAFDSTGNVVTYGAANAGGAATDAVLTYAPNSSGAAAPLRTWSFASPSIRYAGPTGLALDASGNFYLSGIMHTSLGPAPGIFVNSSADASNDSATPSRTIPWDIKTQLIPGQAANVSLDGSGEIYEGNFTVARGTTATCQGQVNVFASGAAGGTTDAPPLRVLTLDGVASSNPSCYSPSNPLTGFYPFVQVYGNTIFVADEFANTIGEFPTTGHGTTKPSRALSGSATGLNVPIGVFVTPPAKAHADATSGPALVRFVEGAPLLETRVGGAPVGLGTAFLQVNKTTVASYFPYGWITPYAPYPGGVLSLRVLDSLGYSVGPFKTAALAAGKSYSIALVGTYPKYSLLTFADAAPSKPAASLAVYEASPAAPKVDFGTYKVSKSSGFRQLGTARFGAAEVRSLGDNVSNIGAYVGSGKTPMTGGQIALASVNSFDRHNALPFHNASRLSLFVLDPLSGSLLGPVFGVFDQ